MMRALQITQHIKHPVYIFSSRRPHAKLPKNAHFIHLPEDIVEGYTQPPNSAYHYTPWSDKIFDRTRVFMNAIQEHKITHMYVDVSAEIVHLSKLLGLTVGSAVMHGNRTERAHTYMYNAADYLLSHNSLVFDSPENRTTDTPIEYSGGISRYKKRAPRQFKSINSALIVSSRLSSEFDTHTLEALARAFPYIQWNVIGPTNGNSSSNLIFHGVVESYEGLADSTDVIIGSGGNNTIMEAASLAKPFICIPEDRPYDEQRTAAQTLERLNAAIHLSQFPTPEEWGELVERLGQVDLTTFSALVDDSASEKAATIIERHF